MRYSYGKKILTIFSPLILIGLLTFITPTLGNQTTHWTYDFDQEMPEEFDILFGKMDIMDNALTTTDCVTSSLNLSTSYLPCFATARFPHTKVTGTWSFDYFRSNEDNSDLFVFIAAKGDRGEVGTNFDRLPEKGYCLMLSANELASNPSIKQLQFGRFRTDGTGCEGTLIDDFNLSQGWHNIQIERLSDFTMSLVINNEYIAETDIQCIVEAEYVNLQLSNGDRIDNLSYSELNSDPSLAYSSPEGGASEISDMFNPVVIGTIVSLIGMSVFGYSRIHKFNTNRHLKAMKKDFANLPSYLKYSILLTIDTNENNSIEDIELAIDKLVQYQFLMHPIRLAILKILFETDVIVSGDIRKVLDISWSKYTPCLTSLEQKGYLRSITKFDDNQILSKHLTLTEKGINDYNDFLANLKRFIDVGNDDLYPSY